MLTKQIIEELPLNPMQKNLVAGMLQNRSEEMKRYSDIKAQVEKVFGSSKRFKEIHTITDDIHIIEQENPFEDTDSDNFYEVMVDGKKAPMGVLSLDAAIILAICYKHGEVDFHKYCNKVLGIK